MPYVRKLDSGLWRVQYRDAEGKRQGASFVKERDARAWGYAREAEVRAGLYVDQTLGQMLLRDWCEKWWEARVVAETTRAANRIRLDRHVLPRWGDVPLDEIETMDVQAWVRQLQKGGLGGDSIRNCHGLLSNMLDKAVIARRVPANLARGVTLPPKGLGREVFLTEDQVEQVVRHFDEAGRDQDGTIVLTLAYLGLRWSELAGLTQKRVAMLRRSVEIRDVLEQVSSRRTLREYPKGKRRRTLPIPEELLERLSEHMRLHPTKGDELLFRRLDGTEAGAGYDLRPEGLSRGWSRTWAAALQALPDLPQDATPHDLRHSYASWMVMDGVPLRTVQALLGHESITTTERYSHLAPDANERALEALQRRAHRRRQGLRRESAVSQGTPEEVPGATHGDSPGPPLTLSGGPELPPGAP